MGIPHYYILPLYFTFLPAKEKVSKRKQSIMGFPHYYILPLYFTFLPAKEKVRIKKAKHNFILNRSVAQQPSDLFSNSNCIGPYTFQRLSRISIFKIFFWLLFFAKKSNTASPRPRILNRTLPCQRRQENRTQNRACQQEPPRQRPRAVSHPKAPAQQ